MNRSFQRTLLLHIGSAVLLLGLLVAALQFVLAWRELRDAQDDMLHQVAALALLRPGRDAARLGHIALDDNDTRIHVVVLPNDNAPPWLEPNLRDGLHTVRGPDGALRVYVLRRDAHTAIAAQPTDARDEMAWNGAWRALLPSLLLVPLLLGWIGRVVRSGFAPIARAAHAVETQHILHQPSLQLDGVPAEIQPFVQAIEGLLARTHALLQQQQRFVADAAHELRSPLTALALQAGNLRRAQSLAEVHERLQPLEQGIARARKLSEQLLDLARLDAQPHPTESVDLGALARELLAAYHPEAERRGIDLGLDAAETIQLRSSALLLRTVLSNAIDNALKYTPEHGSVTLALRRSVAGVRCEVSDSGPGIPAAEREAVFQPFRRLHDNTTSGSGLGLAIAREAASRLGATLTLHEREPGPGLTLRLELADPELQPSLHQQ